MEKKFGFRVVENSLCITEGEDILIRDAEGYMTYDGNTNNVVKLTALGKWTVDGNTASCGNEMLEMKPIDNGFLIRMAFTYHGEDLFTRGELTALSGTLQRTIERGVLNHYYHQNGNDVLEMQGFIDTVHTVYNTVYDSAEHTVFDTEEGDAYMLGAATFEKHFSGVTYTREGFITTHENTEWHRIPDGTTLYSEWYCFARVKDCVTGLLDYAKTVAALAGVKRSEKENPAGFCSWYYYLNHISPETVRQNMAVLDQHKDDLPVKYIQIDDGWFDVYGSWKPNEKFADIKELAAEIKAHGYIPGIWLAPFGCSKNAELFKQHPEYFVQDPNGGVWRNPSIDYTHPEAREYMAKVIRRLTYEYGFEYLKMDCISPSLAPGVHHDPNVTSLENYRLGLRIIRENTPKGTFLLGCTSPLGGACGLVDGMRVGYDVKENWDSICVVFNAVLRRYYFHRNFFLNDADCLIIRKKENEDEECFRQCTRTDTEIRTYLTAMAASGGILMLSDKLPNLKDEQLRLISKLFPVNQEAALPLDMMESCIPGVLDFGTTCGIRTVAFCNWGNVEKEFSVQNREALVWEFWDKEFFVHNGGEFTAEIEPHASKVFCFADPCETALIGSDANIKMQTEWKNTEGSITVKRLKPDEKTYFASKHGIKIENGKAVKITEKNGYTVYEISANDDLYTVC